MYWHLEGGSNSQFDVSNALEVFYFAKVSNNARIATVLPEIFARVLFSLNFAVGAGPCNLSLWNFCCTRKFWLCGIIASCTMLARGVISYTLWSYYCAHLSPFLTSSWRCLSCDTCSQFQINARVPSGCASNTARMWSLATWLQNLPRAICCSLSDQFVKQILVNFRDT